MNTIASSNVELTPGVPTISMEPALPCPSTVGRISEKLSNMIVISGEMECDDNALSKITKTGTPESKYDCCVDHVEIEGKEEVIRRITNARDDRNVEDRKSNVESFAGDPNEDYKDTGAALADGIENEEDPLGGMDGESFAGDSNEDYEGAGAALVDGIENEKDPCGEVNDDSLPLFFVMDCEASSGVPYRDDIVEIALKCWPYRENLEDSLFYSLIHTSKYLCKFAKEHGFSKKLLNKQPTFKVVMNKLFDWIKDSVVKASQYMNLSLFPVFLCHGGEAFDYLLLFSQLERTGISFQRLEELNLHFADTFPHLEMYQSAKHPLLVNCGSLGIKNLIQQWFGPHDGKAFHRAQNDAEETLRLFSQTPLFGFLHDIPIYSTTVWIEYFEDKKYTNKIKRELEENLPASISGTQRKFTIRLLVRNGLDLESLKALYRECTEPHHFRQELVNLSMKGAIASKLMTYFYSKGLNQVGTKEYIVKIKENMQPQEWTCRTNARGRKFSRRVANVLPPIIPSGGSGFNFEDATEPSHTEHLKDIMESFTKFQLQLNSSTMSFGDQKSWNLSFWNNINLPAERIFWQSTLLPPPTKLAGDTVDAETNLPDWQETEPDWQYEIVDDFKRAPLLPTPPGSRDPPPPLLSTKSSAARDPPPPLLPTSPGARDPPPPLLPPPLVARGPSAPLLPTPFGAREPPESLLPTSFGARGASSPLLPTPSGARVVSVPLLPTPSGARKPSASFSYNNEIRQRPLIPWDKICQENFSAEYKNQKQFKLKKGIHMQQNNESRKKNNRRDRRSRHQQQGANNCRQKDPSGNSILHVKSGHSFRHGFSGHTAKANEGHTVKSNQGHTAQTKYGHTVQANDGHTAKANGHTAKANDGHTAQNIDGHTVRDNDDHTVEDNKDHTAVGNNNRTGQANDGTTAHSNKGHTAKVKEKNTAQVNSGQTAQASGGHTAQENDNQIEQGARRKIYKCKPCENKKQGNDFRYKHGKDGFTNEFQDFKERNNWKSKKSSRYRKK